MFKFPERINNLRKGIENKEFEAVFISNEYNRRYLSGFSGSSGFLLISQSEALLFTDFRYIEQASLEATGFKISIIENPKTWLIDQINKLDLKSIGFESDDVTVDFLDTLKNQFSDKKSKITLHPTKGITSKLREIKSEEEIQLLKKAIQISDKAFNSVSESISVGDSEEDIAWRFEKLVRELGGEAISFDTIVASGPNGARPHHKAGKSLIKEGDTIVFDCGARYQGYCSDLTRTVIVGSPDKFTKKIYETVLAAQETAFALLESGISGSDCDSLSRNIINESGYSKNFGHSLGHGVGLEVHELPGVGPRSTNIISENMVFTIEPGIYIEGWGGVRIEDIVMLNKGKLEILSNAKKERY